MVLASLNGMVQNRIGEKMMKCYNAITIALIFACISSGQAVDFTQDAGTSSTTTNAGDLTGAPANLAAGDTITVGGSITTTGTRGIDANNGGSTITINSGATITTTGQDAVRISSGTVNHMGNIILNGSGTGDHAISITGGATVWSSGNITVNFGGGDAFNGSGNVETFNITGGTISVAGGGDGISAGGGNDVINISDTTFTTTGGGRGIHTAGGNDVVTIINSTITTSGGGNALSLAGNDDTLNLTASRIVANGGGNSINGGGGADTVNLNGYSLLTGTVNGGGGADTINFNNWRGFSQATANALIATGGSGTVTILGSPLTLNSFATVNVTGFQTFSSLLTAPGLSGFASSLDNVTTAPGTEFIDIFIALNSVALSDLNELAQTVSGQVYQNAFSSVAFNNATRMTGDFFSQLRHQGRNAAMGADLTAFQWNTRDLDPMLVNMDQNLLAMSNPGLVSVDTGSLEAATLATAAASGFDPFYDWQAFVIGSGSYAQQDDISGLAESETVSTSVIIGAGKNLSEALNAGGYIGYQSVDSDVDAFGSNMEGNGAQVGGYARYQWGDWLASGILGYSYTAYENERNIVSPTFTGTGESDADAHQFISALELSRDIHFGADRSIRVTPMVGLQYSLLHVEDFQESGLGGAGLSFDDQTAHSLRTKLGFELAKTFEGDWGWCAPYVSAAWHHEFLDNSRDVTTTFIDPALASFTVSTREADADFAVIGAGFNASLTEADNIHFTLGWQLQIGQEGYIVNSATGGVRVDL
ncbi:MAG: autotransporter domain-containing protein [Verrucomicrobiota bacterium]